MSGNISNRTGRWSSGVSRMIVLLREVLSKLKVGLRNHCGGSILGNVTELRGRTHRSNITFLSWVSSSEYQVFTSERETSSGSSDLPVVGQEAIGEHEPTFLVTLEVVGPLIQPAFHVGISLFVRHCAFKAEIRSSLASDSPRWHLCQQWALTCLHRGQLLILGLLHLIWNLLDL